MKVVHLATKTVRVKAMEGGSQSNTRAQTIEVWGKEISTTIIVTMFNIPLCPRIQDTILSFPRHQCTICKVFLMECRYPIQWILKWTITLLSSCLRCRQWLSCSSNNTLVICTNKCNRCKFLNSSNNLVVWTWHWTLLLLKYWSNNLLLHNNKQFLRVLTATTSTHSTNQIFWSIATIPVKSHSR